MRIHTNTLTTDDLREAAAIARVDLQASERYGWGHQYGSRSHDHAFEVKLRGESRRRPNFYNGDGSYAATWDQWGVFLSVLFDRDSGAVCGSAKHPTYNGAADFDYKTNERFEVRADGSYWPDDAHGDHTFRFAGVVREQNCTKCWAVRRWS